MRPFMKMCDYIVNIRYMTPQKFFGSDCIMDSVKFISLEEAKRFVQGDVSYNWLDETVKLSKKELPVSIVDALTGEVLWSKNSFYLSVKTCSEFESLGEIYSGLDALLATHVFRNITDKSMIPGIFLVHEDYELLIYTDNRFDFSLIERVFGSLESDTIAMLNELVSLFPSAAVCGTLPK